jgi:hypothetical protein
LYYGHDPNGFTRIGLHEDTLNAAIAINANALAQAEALDVIDLAARNGVSRRERFPTLGA